MALTRMIFAIQVTDSNPTRIRVSGNVGTPAPAMTIQRREGRALSPVGCVDGSWTMDLDPGDYIIELQVEDGKWLAGRLEIATELTSGQKPPVFVHYGPLPGSPSGVGLATWEPTALYVDSKDPWPPPPPPPPSLAPDSAAWFTAELSAARTRTEAEAPLIGKGMPEFVLAALVTEL